MNRTFKIISLAVLTVMSLTSALAQDQTQQSTSPEANRQTGAAAKGGATPGRIAKFTETKTVGDANITENDSGNIGIGTTTPTSPLTVNGAIETTSAQGGIKFPDGTMQTTAGLTTIFRNLTLNGNGTQASPLSLRIPLSLSGAVPANSVLNVSNTDSGAGIRVIAPGLGGIGVSAEGGSVGIESKGGNSTAANRGGTGIRSNGGNSDTGRGGIGIIVDGGSTTTGEGGTGVFVFGGQIVSGNSTDNLPGIGGEGVISVGGTGSGTGNRGGHGIESSPGRGVNGADKGLAGKFNGDVQVTGILSKAGGSFKIDHPLDPENKYLSHSFVESPDMMNIYNGNITTDNNGLAVVELPDYFDSLNRDFRYQLTVVGQFAQAIVAEEVKDNRFTIQTSAPGVKVSWQVTGVRQDAWANKNRIPVEEKKSEKERGHYLHPEAFGQPEEHGVEWANRPELMRQIKQGRLEAEQQARQPRK